MHAPEALSPDIDDVAIRQLVVLVNHATAAGSIQLTWVVQRDIG